MKAILMSVQPKHLCEILNGKKTIEFRKSRPKCDLPIDVYLYCTKGGGNLAKCIKQDGTSEWIIAEERHGVNGRVWAKFTLKQGYELDVINIMNELEHDDEYEYFIFDHTVDDMTDEKSIGYKSCLCLAEWLDHACISEKEVREYLGDDECQVWVIDNLAILQNPLELKDFYVNLDPKEYTTNINNNGSCSIVKLDKQYKELTRPPQSWQYVEIDI